MKKLDPSGNIVIPSNLPRTRQGPDSRGPRICFSELGRSCSLKTGYLIFTDGSAYVYSPPSNEDVAAMCASGQRGKLFNFVYRRSRFGYVRGFVPPADYETIYSFPPYFGVQPMECDSGIPDWTKMLWSTVTDSPSAGESMFFQQDGTQSASQLLTLTCTGGNLNGIFETAGTFSQVTVPTPCQVQFDVIGSPPPGDWNIQLSVDHDGSNVLFENPFGHANDSQLYTFTIPDSLGLVVPIDVDIFMVANGSLGAGSYDFSFVFSNV